MSKRVSENSRLWKYADERINRLGTSEIEKVEMENLTKYLAARAKKVELRGLGKSYIFQPCK
jgi:hypothetical protein